MPSEQPYKVFTVEEANALLPRVRPLVEQLRALQGSIVTTNEQLDEKVHKLSGGNGYPLQDLRHHIEKLTRHQLQLIEAFHSALQQLEELGCVLKDLSLGLIDFYTVRDGEPAFLCWKLDEETVRFWHPLDAGYAARRPL
ncbi:MAG: hypothetical protein A3I71_04960 [Omnitrophica WOR_2 bacterium RIFCSPLOWO2_02_FULL_63_16]|nr:MAG: hypothetical protein A2Z92_06795 [Omnitrophica WOR_2 bacterium GWA2_63_20]OGX18898.1 MAG: hypothetical protein A2105_01785 [Omnitrophica WOR_2 bacterium GWF2_63_9]OGX33143.1 MAG: hypothetical protein A3E56_02290 [Omnitrophica WOR_2 bacterium RIFCSPHIGHO2_12_FULL_64_13]OGX35791.1 MAG: hypothetical protein A3B73_02615 [Omnitrophica WOR_2 bacterium RIFCSPHIGHO2_02_FULL_63_39]OGX46520.1 MAG: hypothetical protein A3I71_04960 [Omnitrophica WOR_2 bacterium RIFCSPLOWO2_02_FULL_63_16]OGX47477.1